MTKPSEPLIVMEDGDTGNRFIAYTTAKGIQLDCRFDGEQPWFSQRDLATVFGVDVRTVNDHIQKLNDDGELDDSTIRDFRIVRPEGSRIVERPITHYVLDVAFYVGYRVNSTEGKLFRRWATTMLIQLATKGFVVNQRVLKDGNFDRIRELREVILDLRSDEANLYAELRNICTFCQDYNSASDDARKFYEGLQAKIFYAVTSHTPSQIIAARADAGLPNMGLRTWKGERVLQGDVTTGKNYLADGEVKELNRLTSILLDIFEDQADLGRLVQMAQCEVLLDTQLKGLGRAILPNRVGPPSRVNADAHAKEQYNLFNAKRRLAVKQATDDELKALKAAAKELPKTASRRMPKSK